MEGKGGMEGEKEETEGGGVVIIEGFPHTGRATMGGGLEEEEVGHDVVDVVVEQGAASIHHEGVGVLPGPREGEGLIGELHIGGIDVP